MLYWLLLPLVAGQPSPAPLVKYIPPVPTWTLPTVDGTSVETKTPGPDPPEVAEPFFSRYASAFNGPPTALNALMQATGSRMQLFGNPYTAPQPVRRILPDGTIAPRVPLPGPVFGPPGLVPMGLVQPMGLSVGQPGPFDSMMTPTLDLLPNGNPLNGNSAMMPNSALNPSNPMSYPGVLYPGKDGFSMLPYQLSESYPAGPFTTIPKDGTYIIAGRTENKWLPLAPAPTPFGSAAFVEVTSMKQVADMYGVQRHHLDALAFLPPPKFSEDEERLLEQCKKR